MKTAAMCMILSALVACSSRATPAPDDGATERAEPSDSAEVEAYLSARNEICADASNDVARINATWIDAAGATRADLIIGVRKVIARGEQAQQQLAELSVPSSLQQFVDRDASLREEGPSMEQMLVALERGDPVDRVVAEFDAAADQINAQIEANELAYDLAECP